MFFDNYHRIPTHNHSESEIYMRNWNIRAELGRRAYMYDIENKSFRTTEIGSSLNNNLPSVLMRAENNYFNRSQRKASVSNEVEGRFNICSVLERSRMIVTLQNLQCKKIINKFDKTNRTYNSNNLKRLLNEKQYCPDKIINSSPGLSKNSIEDVSNETSMRLFYSNAIHNVSNNCKGTNNLYKNSKNKILKLNRNVIISNSSISDDFYSKSIYIKKKFEIKQNYEHTPPKLNSMNNLL